MSSSNSASDVLGQLSGKQLVAVTFVMDYLQLHFDDATLNAVTLPKVVTSEGTSEPDKSGFCDLLRAQIGSTVVDTYVRNDEEIRLQLDNGSTLSISLRPDDYIKAEAAVLRLGTGEMAVW